MTDPTLLACPFCGSAGHMRTEHDADDVTWHYIGCRSCGARTRGKWHSAGNDCPQLRAEVREEWNRRAAVSAPSVPSDARIDAMWNAAYVNGQWRRDLFVRALLSPHAPDADLLRQALDKAEKALRYALDVVISYEEGGEASEDGGFIKDDLAGIAALRARLEAKPK